MKSDPISSGSATTTPLSVAISTSSPVQRTAISGWLQRWLIRRLQQAGVNGLILRDDNGLNVQLGEDTASACLHIHRPAALWRALRGGMTGWGEGYMAGDWSSPDLRALTHWAARHEQALQQVFRAGPLSHWLNRLLHRLRDNSRRGSRRNIASHYDLGNDFYRLWLDETFSYSSALFSHPQQPLAEAQQAKYDRIVELARPLPGQQIAEIGCGWGGFAETIARRGNLSLHGITLSAEQLAWAQQRIAHLPGADSIELEYRDYRDLHDHYDRVVSIEMFEAVGQRHWPGFFDKLWQILAPGGTAVLQIICIAETKAAHYQRHTDFIQRYIFPGGMLPSVSAVQKLAQQRGFISGELQRFGPDYGRTLQHWYQRFEQQWPDIAQQGFDERFRRMWRYYLAYCEAGFRSGALDVCLFQLHRPG
ncbi:MAG: cyclopropane-fatty-acyl-phospholipid synthase family protein [Marinobacterium sp.]|nr:cyclopropane-fatty-acyl-phospholipid synthase family protein [Marinobacterium sp.]